MINILVAERGWSVVLSVHVVSAINDATDHVSMWCVFQSVVETGPRPEKHEILTLCAFVLVRERPLIRTYINRVLHSSFDARGKRGKLAILRLPQAVSLHLSLSLSHSLRLSCSAVTVTLQRKASPRSANSKATT